MIIVGRNESFDFSKWDSIKLIPGYGIAMMRKRGDFLESLTIFEFSYLIPNEKKLREVYSFLVAGLIEKEDYVDLGGWIEDDV